MSTLQTTTSTDRGSLTPGTGETYFETDTKNIIVYDGTNWRGYANDGISIPPISNSYNLSFDGTTDLVNVGDLSSLLSSTANSFSWWFKYDDITVDLQHMFGADDNETGVPFDATKRGFLCLGRPVSTETKIDFTYYGSSTSYVSGSFTHTPDTNWHHIVITFDASANTFDAYFDGVNQNVTPNVINTVSTFQRPSINYTVGARKSSSPNRFFKGRIDEVAFWDVELDSNNAIQLYNSGSGGKPFDLSSNAGDYNQSANLQGWWRFENNGNDSTSNSSAATVSGATFVSNNIP